MAHLVWWFTMDLPIKHCYVQQQNLLKFERVWDVHDVHTIFIGYEWCMGLNMVYIYPWYHHDSADEMILIVSYCNLQKERSFTTTT